MEMDAPNGSAVKITLADVYNAVQGLRDEVRSNASEFKSHVQLPIHPGARETVTDHEARIRILEASGSHTAMEALKEAKRISDLREKDIRDVEAGFVAIRMEVQGQCEVLQRQHSKLSNKVNWALGAAAAVVVASDIFLRYFAR